MEFNWLVITILLVVTVSVLHFEKFKFQDAFLFFIPFNGTVVFFTSSGTAVNLPFALGTLSIITFFFKYSLHDKFRIPHSRLIAYQWLLVIGIVAIVSQIMPYLIDGEYQVLDRYNRSVYWAEEYPLVPKMQWITQCLYFLIGLLLVFVISMTYKTIKELKRALTFFLYGISFMVFWGWYGDLTYFLPIPYPQWFNQIGMYEFGVAKEAFNNFPRMTSVTMEPSYLAQMLIPATPFFYWFGQQEKSFVFKRNKNKNLYIFSLITLFIAITTTGILGLIVLIGLWLLNNLRFYNRRSKAFLLIIYIALSTVLLFLVFLYLQSVSQTYSGVERFKTVIYGYKYFKDYFLLGLGWGVFPTYDLVINLLVNFGLLGTIPFGILIWNIFKKLAKRFKSDSELVKPIRRAGLESFALILIVSQMSGFIYHSQYFWVYLALAISFANLKVENE